MHLLVARSHVTAPKLTSFRLQRRRRVRKDIASECLYKRVGSLLTVRRQSADAHPLLVTSQQFTSRRCLRTTSMVRWYPLQRQ